MTSKNKMNTILRMAGFIAIAAMIGFSITACDFLMDLLHEHDYGDTWKTNATQHWKECDCGDKIDVGNHSNGYFTGNSCYTCGKTHEHVYGDTYKRNASEHWKECACGVEQSSSRSSHYYGYWGKNETHHWKECLCGARNDNINTLHSFSATYKYDATQHWRECECYQKGYVGNHTFTSGSSMCTFGDCYYTKSVNTLFVGSWIQYYFYSDGTVTYNRYTFNDDGTGTSESKMFGEPFSFDIIWSAAGGKLMIAIVVGELSAAQNYNYLIEKFTLSMWTDDQSSASKYIRQAGDGSMDERLTADTWINDETASQVEELRFFPDGTATLRNIYNGFISPYVTDYIWTAKNGQYELYASVAQFPELRETRTYTISGYTLNVSNTDGSGAKTYTKKYGSGYEIGATGPGGGKVIYDKGNDKDGWRYMEAALENLGSGIGWASTDTFVPSATGQEIGTGKANTLAIIAAFPDDTELNNASIAAAAYRGGGKDDWFLPSRYELDQLYKQKSLFGITEGNYFTSSEYGEDSPANVFALGFSGNYEYGLWVGVPKSWTNASNYNARPVRYF